MRLYRCDRGEVVDKLLRKSLIDKHRTNDLRFGKMPAKILFVSEAIESDPRYYGSLQPQCRDSSTFVQIAFSKF